RGISSPKDFKVTNWPPARALAPGAGRFGSAFVMLLTMGALVAGMVVLVTTRPSKSTDKHPVVGATPGGETPTPPPVIFDGSPQIAGPLRPVAVITTTLFPREGIA